MSTILIYIGMVVVFLGMYGFNVKELWLDIKSLVPKKGEYK